MDDLICPITREVFRNPVIASDGYTYEKCALKCWLKNNSTSPMTRERLVGKFMENETIKELVENIKDDDNKHPKKCLECLDINQKYLDIKNWNKKMFAKLNESQLKVIIDKIDLECSNNHGYRPIHMICRFSTPEMIRFMINKRVNLNVEVKDGDKDRSLIDLIRLNGRLLDFEKVELEKEILDALYRLNNRFGFYIFSIWGSIFSTLLLLRVLRSVISHGRD